MPRVSHNDAKPPARPRKPGEPATLTLSLHVDLSPEELAERSQEAAELLGKRDSLEADYKAAASKGRIEVAGMDVKLRQLGGIIRDGKELRRVECRLEPDYRAGVMRTIRNDTGDVEDDRALTAEERQMEVPGS